MKKNILILISIFISACSTSPTQQEMISADYGSYPMNYEQIIKEYMQSVLKDPDSARYSFLNSPKRGWFGFGVKNFGYAICVNINSKNSFGGYVGNSISYFFIKNEKVIDASIGSGGDYGDAVPKAKCSSYIN